MRLQLTTCLAAATLCAAQAPNDFDRSNKVADSLRMNQVQVLGSHNSYKQQIDDSLWSLLMKAGDQSESSICCL